MSLIVARSTKSSILVVADTKISELNDSANTYLQGLSKVLFVDETRLIAFAGDVSFAYKSIEQIDRNYSNEKNSSTSIV